MKLLHTCSAQPRRTFSCADIHVQLSPVLIRAHNLFHFIAPTRWKSFSEPRYAPNCAIIASTRSTHASHGLVRPLNVLDCIHSGAVHSFIQPSFSSLSFGSTHSSDRCVINCTASCLSLHRRKSSRSQFLAVARHLTHIAKPSPGSSPRCLVCTMASRPTGVSPFHTTCSAAVLPE